MRLHLTTMGCQFTVEWMLLFMPCELSLMSSLTKVITKIDGVGAFDHVYRSSIMSKLLSLPSAHRGASSRRSRVVVFFFFFLVLLVTPNCKTRVHREKCDTIIILLLRPSSSMLRSSRRGKNRVTARASSLGAGTTLHQSLP